MVSSYYCSPSSKKTLLLHLFFSFHLSLYFCPNRWLVIPITGRLWSLPLLWGPTLWPWRIKIPVYPSAIAKGISAVLSVHCILLHCHHTQRWFGHCFPHSLRQSPYTLVLLHTHMYGHTPRRLLKIHKLIAFSHDFPHPFLQSLVRFNHTHAFVNPSTPKDSQVAFTKSFLVQLSNLPQSLGS